MKKLHIGILIVSWGWAGAEEMVYQLTSCLLKLNVKISLFVNDELVDHYRDIKGISIYSLGSINKKDKFSVLVSYYRMRRKLDKILKSNLFDLIHVHLEGSFFVLSGLTDKYKLPLICTLHGIEIKNYFERTSFLDYRLLKGILERAEAITSSNSSQIQNLENKYKLKTIIIPNGVNTKEFKPLKLKREARVILFAGRLIELKGIMELLEVARQLTKYTFWFAGSGSLSEFINLPNTVKLGFKTRTELIDLYNRTTICCFPSHYESFGNVGLESMACGCPVVATKLGFSEYVKNNVNGLIVEAKNTEQLREAIVKLMEDVNLRKSLGKNARETALKFDWQGIVKKYYNLYKDVAEKKTS